MGLADVSLHQPPLHWRQAAVIRGGRTNLIGPDGVPTEPRGAQQAGGEVRRPQPLQPAVPREPSLAQIDRVHLCQSHPVAFDCCPPSAVGVRVGVLVRVRVGIRVGVRD